MKKNLLAFFCIAFTLTGFSQSEKYLSAMKSTLDEMHLIESLEDIQNVANKFERIAMAEQGQWLPWYYATYCNIISCYFGLEADNIDPQLDKAQGMLDKAREIKPENDEIEVLQGYLYQARIQVDPQARGYSYSMKSNAAFNKARKINTGNPRIDFLIAQNLLYTPEAFGGGAAAACPKFRSAAEKFESFKPESEISPDWGRDYNRKMIEEHCGEY